MKFTLYQFEQCPYCAKVRKALDDKKIEYTKVNISAFRDAKDRQDLNAKSGVWTVPVLKVDTEKKPIFIGESDKIIEWLEST